MPLTPKQEKFSAAYAEGGDGAQAARTAGYSEDYAPQSAHRLLNKPQVRARVDELKIENEAARLALADTFIAKLEPVFTRRLEKGDDDGAMQVVELQGRLAGVIGGGRFVPRRIDAKADEARRREEEEDRQIREMLAKFK